MMLYPSTSEQTRLQEDKHKSTLVLRISKKNMWTLKWKQRPLETLKHNDEKLCRNLTKREQDSYTESYTTDEINPSSKSTVSPTMFVDWKIPAL